MILNWREKRLTLWEELDVYWIQLEIHWNVYILITYYCLRLLDWIGYLFVFVFIFNNPSLCLFILSFFSNLYETDSMFTVVCCCILSLPSTIFLYCCCACCCHFSCSYVTLFVIIWIWIRERRDWFCVINCMWIENKRTPVVITYILYSVSPSVE